MIPVFISNTYKFYDPDQLGLRRLMIHVNFLPLYSLPYTFHKMSTLSHICHFLLCYRRRKAKTASFRLQWSHWIVFFWIRLEYISYRVNCPKLRNATAQYITISMKVNTKDFNVAICLWLRTRAKSCSLKYILVWSQFVILIPVIIHSFICQW